MKTKMLFCVFFISTCLFSTIINVPANQPTIQAGIVTAADTDTVLVADGTYYENINFIGKAITVASNFLIDADPLHIENTIINGSQPEDPDYGSCVRFRSGEGSFSVITGFTIMEGTGYYYPGEGFFGGGILCESASPSIISNIITSNSADGSGGIECYVNSSPKILNNLISNNTVSLVAGGIDCWNNSNPFIQGNQIINNAANKAGGIMISNSSPTLINNIIIGNSANVDSGAIQIQTGSQPIFYNNIISNNTANQDGGCIVIENAGVNLINCTMSGNSCGNNGGCLYVSFGVNLILVNTIFEGNQAYEGSEIYFYDSDNVNISFCDFFNDENVFGGLVPTWLETITGINYYDIPCDDSLNIYEDPMFTGNFEDPFSLSSVSPCVDTGIQDVTGLNLPLFDIIGNPRIADGRGDGIALIDIGAYELPETGGVYQHQIPVTEYQLSNYPNPFNPTTKIDYALPAESDVILSIYNIRGQLVKKIKQNDQPAGYHHVYWHGKDNNSKSVASGVYFYRITAEAEYENVRKMVLLR